ncbi:MAG: ABC transporter ATP-binding protein [Clostridia bacterium]|nr:ABC transporter ATP-binding protein [Clostridia bacterium]
MKFSEHIKIYTRAVKMLFSFSRAYAWCTLLGSMIAAIIPYVPIYFSARLIDALYERAPLPTLLLYAALTVGLVFLLQLLNTYISSRRSIASGQMYRGENWTFSEKAMQMAYESIEDREVSLLRERIRIESQTGYNLYFLYNSFHSLVFDATNLLAALTLSISFFALPGIRLYMKLLFVLGVALTVACNIWATKRNVKLNHRFNDEVVKSNLILDKFYQYVEDYSSGKDIRLYGMADTLADFAVREDDFFCRAMIRKNVRAFSALLLTTVVQHVLRFGTYAILIYAALAGGVTVGSIAQYVSALFMMLGGISGLISAAQTIFENNKYLARYFSYHDIPNHMYQGSLTVEKRDDNEYYVEFRDVSFKYPNSDAWALRHVNLKFRVGEKLAVVGMNGSGKTTFIKLMCRLYDPTEGEILLNGVNIKKYDYDEYMSIFSVVFQDFRLLSFNLGQNVAASADYDGERVKRCLEQAGFGERLTTMPDGLETHLYRDIAQNGVEISGGEAQKIALARALYKDAPFIILDEPTAALDPISEYEVYSKFNEIAGEKTAIYISHRLASCRFCAKIAVFDHGGIVQTGSHNQLISDPSGKYHELWHAQAQYYTE